MRHSAKHRPPVLGIIIALLCCLSVFATLALAQQMPDPQADEVAGSPEDGLLEENPGEDQDAVSQDSADSEESDPQADEVEGSPEDGLPVGESGDESGDESDEGSQDAPDDTVLMAQANSERTVEVTSWAELKAAIDGCKYDEKVHIRMKEDIKATSTDEPLQVNGSKNIAIHLEGHTLDRGLTKPTDNGYVLMIGAGSNVTLTADLRWEDPMGTDLITGGNNTGDGGAIWNAGSLTIERINFLGNVSQKNGGAIYNASKSECGWDASLTIFGSVFKNNEAQGNGGGICNYGSLLKFIGASSTPIENNVAHGNGGGIYSGGIDGATNTVLLDMTYGSSRIADNTARNGGGIYCNGRIEKIDYGYTIEHNTATENGGGIYCAGRFDFNCEILSNIAHGNGGGLYVDEPVGGNYKAYGNIDGNTADGNGGGIYVKAVGDVVVGRDVTGNTAHGDGGGIYVESGYLIVQDRAGVRNNTANNGGGIYVANGGALKLHGDDCPVTDNTASKVGGGVYVSAKADKVDIAGNVKVLDNTAETAKGVFLGGDKKLNIVGVFYGEPHIEVTLGKITGSFTTGYSDKNFSHSPSEYFYPVDPGLTVVSENFEAKMAIDMQNVTYIERSWNGTEVVSEQKTCTNPRLLSETKGMNSGGWYLLDRNWNSNQRIDVTKDSSLILFDGVTLNTQGIYIQKGKTLTIYGQSKDTGKIVSVAKVGAAIGATHDNHPGGNLIVHGGTIEATGARHCAGIGSNDGNGSDVGSFTMYGGTVTAKGGKQGAGIGGGRDCDGGTIKIYGGKVTAEGTDSSAGIGGSDASGKREDTSTIEVYGGTVTAKGNSKGSGIGGGEYGHATVRIFGGTIVATGGSSGGAGIGSGVDGTGSSISITGGNVTAIAGQGGYGIGNGKNRKGATSTVTLGYTDGTRKTISIKASSYNGRVRLAEDFRDATDGTIFPAANPMANPGALSGRTLVAAISESETAEPAFRTHSLLLDGSIGVRFFMELPEIEGVDYASSYMEFSVSGRGSVTEIDPFDAGDTNASGTYYAFTCNVSSVQMADAISATFRYGDGQTVSQTYSISEYVAEFAERAGDFDESTVGLVHALADYGHYVQPYLARVNGWSIGADHAEMPANGELPSDAVAAAREACQPYACSCDMPKGGEVVSVGIGLDLMTDTTAYLVANTVEGADLKSATLADGTALQVGKTPDGRASVAIPKIMAHHLGDVFDVTLVTTGGTEAHAHMAAVSFANAMFAAPDHQDDVEALEMATSLWRYWEAADAYVKAHPESVA